MKNKKNKKIKGLNEGHYVEAIDRAYIVANMIEDVLIEHPVIRKHKELKHRVRKAQEEILNVYQMIGGLSVDLFPNPAQQADKK
jgi:hypothetical protein